MTQTRFTTITESQLDQVAGGAGHPWRQQAEALNYSWKDLKSAYGKTGAKFFVAGAMLP